MITLSKSGSTVTFTFDENSGYLQNGTIDVPVNSLALIIDESDMATFRKSASNDIFISAIYEEFGMSKAELEAWYKENMVGDVGGGVDSGTVQTMIDESISGKADTTAVTEAISAATDDMATKTWVGEQGYLTEHQSLSAYSTTEEVNSAITEATSGKVDTSTYNTYTANTATEIGNKLAVSDFNTYSGAVDTTINSKASQSDLSALTDVVSAHTANTDIHVTTAQTAAWNAKSDFSGSYNDLTDKPTIPTVPTSNTAFTNDAGYITEDAISGKADSSAVTEEISAAVSGKVDTSTFETYSGSVETALSGKQDTLSAGTNITISGNVISAEGGGGKAVVGGRGITVTSGETADTVSFNLPISADTDGSVNKLIIGSGNTIGSNTEKNIIIGDDNTTFGQGGGRYYTGATIIGYNNRVGLVGMQDDTNDWSFAIGRRNQINGGNSFIIGTDNNFNRVFGKKINNLSVLGHHNQTSSLQTDERGIGQWVIGAYNEVSKQGETAIGIYNLTKKDGTTSGNTIFTIGNGTADNARHNAFEIRQNGDIYITSGSTDIKLQDHLGGGGGGTSYTAGDGIDITNDVISVTGKVDTSAITTSITSSSTDAQVPSAKAVNDKLGGLKLVKLSQSEYDSLATKDNSTLYVIVN